MDIIFVLVPLILFILIAPMVIIFTGIKHWCSKCKNYREEARERREQEIREQERRAQRESFEDIIRPFQQQLEQEQQRRHQLQLEILIKEHERQELEARILMERQDRENQDKERQQLGRQRQETYKEDANQVRWGICQDNVFENEKVVAVLPCGHTFHESCIIQWVNRKNNCPYCKRTVQSNDIIQKKY